MKRVVLLVIVALALGGFAAYGTYLVQSQAEERALSKFDAVEVLVTAADIPASTSFVDALASGLIQRVKYPIEYLPLDALRKLDDENPKDLALEALPAGRLVLAGDFGVPSNQGASLVVPTGYTAVSLALTIENRTGGFLQPGREVAVIGSNIGDVNSTSNVTTKTLFSGLKVLAVGQNTVRGLSLSQNSDDTQNVVTLAVRPSDVVELLNAVQSGSISLVLLARDTQVPFDIVTSE